MIKRHENIVAATYKPLTASERAILRMRGNKRRSTIERGLIRVHFVKLLHSPQPEPSYRIVDKTIRESNQRISQPDLYEHFPMPQPQPAPKPRKCGLGWCHNAALDGYAVCAEHLPQQPERVPEPQPFCTTCNREVELRHLVLLNGAYFCRFCTGLVNWPPYHGPERPQEWTRCAGDGAAICQDCKRTFFQAHVGELICAECWQKTITPPSPPWDGPEGGAA